MTSLSVIAYTQNYLSSHLKHKDKCSEFSLKKLDKDEAKLTSN